MTSTSAEPTGLTPDEEKQVEFVIRGADTSNLAAVGIALGGGFLVYQHFMRRRLKEAITKADPTPEDLAQNLQTIFSFFGPTWLRMIAPVLVAGYINGLRETKLDMSADFLHTMAERYALELGEHLNEVSGEAMVSGFTAQINRKVAPKTALANVLDAFGVTNRTMKTLVNVWTQNEDAKLSEVVMPSVKKARARRLILGAVKERATMMGEQESWNAKEQAKQISWMYALKKGILPETSTRMWVTADDELVCPHCGPLHKKEIGIDAQFETQAGKFWSPPLHPNCRCEVKIRLNVADSLFNNRVHGGSWLNDLIEEVPDGTVSKADDDDWDPREHPRARDGKFTHARRGTKTADIDLDAALKPRQSQVEALQEVLNRPIVEQKEETPVPTITRAQIVRTTIENPKISVASINRARIEQPKIGGGEGAEGKIDSQAKIGTAAAIHAHGKIKTNPRKFGQAQARFEEQLRETHPVIIPGEVDKPKPDPKKHHEGMIRLEEPVYAVLDGNGVSQRNEEVRIDGVEMVGNAGRGGALVEAIERFEQEQDEDFLEAHEENPDRFQDIAVQDGNDEYERQIYFDDVVLGQVIEWARQQSSDDPYSDANDAMIEVPVLGHVDTDTGVELTTLQVSHLYEDNMEENVDFEELVDDTEMMPASVIADRFGIRDYVRDYQPRLVSADVVPENDVFYDAEGVPSAAPRGDYRLWGTQTVQVGGRTYIVHPLDPA